MHGRRHHYNVFASASNFAGGYSFTGEISAPNTTGGNSVNALADFLLGDVKTASYTITQPMNGHRGYNLFVAVSRVVNVICRYRRRMTRASFWPRNDFSLFIDQQFEYPLIMYCCVSDR